MENSPNSSIVLWYNYKEDVLRLGFQKYEYLDESKGACIYIRTAKERKLGNIGGNYKAW